MLDELFLNIIGSILGFGLGFHHLLKKDLLKSVVFPRISRKRKKRPSSKVQKRPGAAGGAWGRLLGRPGGVLGAPGGASWAPLGESWGLPGGLLGRLGALLGRSFSELKF